jgi:hypothetical protein
MITAVARGIVPMQVTATYVPPLLPVTSLSDLRTF